MLIHTLRTMIRPFQLSDMRDVHSLCTRIEVMQHIPPAFTIHTSEGETINRLQRYLSQFSSFGVSMGYVCDTQSHFIGIAGIFFSTDSQQYEIGYALLPEYWGAGLATEIVKGLQQYAFDIMCLDMLVANTTLDNISSQKVLAKTGFNLMGERVYDKISDARIWKYYECPNYNILPDLSNEGSISIAEDDWALSY